MHSELSSPPDQYPLTPKLQELGRRRRRIDLEELEWSRLAAEVAASGEHQKYGFFNPVDWLRVTFGMGEGAVRDRITVGRQLDRLPLAMAAMENGEIGFGHLVVLARTAEALRDRPIDEAKLLRRAREQTVSRFHYTCESYRHAADAEGVAAEAEDLHEKRELMIRRRRDGMFTIWGRLEPVTGSALRAALAPHARRRDRGDARTFPQRLHDALAEHLAGRQTTSVNVTMSLETLLAVQGASAGEIQGAPLLAQPTVQRLLCDCGVRRVVLDPKSVVVDVGRSRRVVTPAGRAALESREKGLCGCPGCDRSGRTIHHLKPWAQGGPTDLENQVLLCYWHHRMVHEGGWRLARVETGELMLVRPPPALPTAASGLVGNSAERVQVTLERVAPALRKREPGASALAYERLVDLDMPGLLQRGHLLREDRVADLHVIADEAELHAVGGRQQSHDREAHRVG